MSGQSCIFRTQIWEVSLGFDPDENNVLLNNLSNVSFPNCSIIKGGLRRSDTLSFPDRTFALSILQLHGDSSQTKNSVFLVV